VTFQSRASLVYYVPEMKVDGGAASEVLRLRDRRVAPASHPTTAFEDPTTPPDAPPAREHRAQGARVFHKA